MNKITLSFVLIFFSSVFQVKGQNLAQTPPMGWNSYDCFGTAVLESDVKGNADVMATLLLKPSWCGFAITSGRKILYCIRCRSLNVALISVIFILYFLGNTKFMNVLFVNQCGVSTTFCDDYLY